LIEPEVEAEGLALVRVKMTGGTSDPTIQIMAERPDTRQLTIEDCERLHRRIAERHDHLSDDCRLEVSSPGIDRPLTRLKDYADWAGQEARISLAEPRGGRKQYSGTLEGVDGENVKLTDKSGVAHVLPFRDISSAKLLLTDKLINATAPLTTDGADTIQMQEEDI
jgi:ribosome maturation factor RimP